jgi:hypothetical protein
MVHEIHSPQKSQGSDSRSQTLVESETVEPTKEELAACALYIAQQAYDAIEADKLINDLLNQINID